MKNKDPLAYNLGNMIRSPNYFDQGVAEYILHRMGSEELKKIWFENGYILKNFTIEMNAFGLVKLENRVLETNKEWKDHKTNAEHYNRYLQDFNLWSNLLSKVDNTLPSTDLFALTKTNGINKGVKTNVSFEAILIVEDIERWIKMDILTPTEEMIIIEDILEDEQNKMLHTYTLDKKPEFVVFLMEKIALHLKALQKKMFKNDEEMTNKMLSSPSIKTLLTIAPPHLITGLFSNDSLRAIIKKAELAENLKTHPHMLSNLLPLAPAEKWIEAYEKNNNFDIFTFFSAIMKKATGQSFKDTKSRLYEYDTWDHNKKNKGRYLSAQKEIIERLDYLGNELHQLNFGNEQLMLWYASIFHAKNTSLYMKSREFIPLPEINKKTEHFYEVLFVKTVDSKSKDNKSWKELETQFQKEKLEASLISSSVNKVKRIKI